MRLLSLSVGCFLSYRSSVSVDFEPDVTIFADRNNVGETALIRAFQSASTNVPGAGANVRLDFRWELTRPDLDAAFADKEFGALLRDRLPIGDCVLTATYASQQPSALPRIDFAPGIGPRVGTI